MQSFPKEGPGHGLLSEDDGRAGSAKLEEEPKREQRWLPLCRKTTGQLAGYFSLESLTAPLVLEMVALVLGQVADWLEKKGPYVAQILVILNNKTWSQI